MAPETSWSSTSRWNPGSFFEWYYENQLIISTTREKIIRYKNGSLYFYLPLEG